MLLGIPESDVWKLKFLQEYEDNGIVFPKRLVDPVVETWSNVPCRNCQDDNLYKDFQRKKDRLKKEFEESIVELKAQIKSLENDLTASQVDQTRLKQRIAYLHSRSESSQEQLEDSIAEQERCRETLAQMKANQGILKSQLSSANSKLSEYKNQESKYALQTKLEDERSRSRFLAEKLKKCREELKKCRDKN